MKINDILPQLENSSHLEEQFFSIQDQSMIFEILRNKMYSNPIAAICREISCNARDAHREVGKANIPIHIHLPNVSEPFYKIKDFGPGISPDRMSNIFIKYTASTKRGDNIQTGGFGLGAKTPFAYSDTFSIITNYNGKKYNYICFIDETKIGKLSLVSESNTSEENGTEIIIPIKKYDFGQFADQTEYCTRHWDVRPIIKGGKITWTSVKELMRGDNWLFCNTMSWNRDVKLIIDGIEYPLELSSIKLHSIADIRLIENARGHLFIYFNVGELSLSANREQVYLDKPTQTKIANRFTSIVEEIKASLNKEIEKASNLLEAYIVHRKKIQHVFHDAAFLGHFCWRDISIGSYTSLNIGCPVISFMKGKYRYESTGNNFNKLARISGNSIVFEDNTMLFINDLGIKSLTIKHIKKAFDDNPRLQSAQIICPTDKVTLDFLNKNYNLDKMSPGLISSITKYSARKFNNSSNKLIVYKFDPQFMCFKQASYASIDDDVNHKVLCYLSKDTVLQTKSYFLNKDNSVTPYVLHNIMKKYSTYSFYAIDIATSEKRIKKDFVGFQPLEDFIKENILSKPREHYIINKLLYNRLNNIDDSFVKYYSPIIHKINNKNSLFLNRLNQHAKFSKLSSLEISELDIYEIINGAISENEISLLIQTNPNYNLEACNKQYLLKYPLLNCISIHKQVEVIDHVIDYINLIDSKEDLV